MIWNVINNNSDIIGIDWNNPGKARTYGSLS